MLFNGPRAAGKRQFGLTERPLWRSVEQPLAPPEGNIGGEESGL